MQFEDLDKRIREAAEQHYPAYDERAWQKMEKLLDEHLPQAGDNRRRFMFLLLLLVMIGVGGFLLISRPWNKEPGSSGIVQESQKDLNNKELIGNNEKNEVKNPVVQSTPETGNGNIIGNSQNNIQKKDVAVTLPVQRANALRKEPTDRSTTNPGTGTTKIEKAAKIRKNKSERSNLPDQMQPQVVEKEAQPAIVKNEQPNRNPVSNENPSSNIKPVEEIAQTNAPVTEKTERAGETKQDVVSAPQVVKEDAKKPLNKAGAKTWNGFSFSASFGPDVSQVSSSQAGKLTLAYGLGVGYTRNRVTLRTGIFKSKKIYSTAAKYYKLSYPPPPNYTLETVDADCSVIEIPLKVSYNFGTDSHRKMNDGNWFASAGLSSYLMKKEDYIYNFKAWGVNHPYNHDVKNKNKHYFSVLDLSAGYTRHLNNTFSITAEPYLSIPLTGIGEGKVRLNSGGVLFTVGVHPFRK